MQTHTHKAQEGEGSRFHQQIQNLSAKMCLSSSLLTHLETVCDHPGSGDRWEPLFQPLFAAEDIRCPVLS